MPKQERLKLKGFSSLVGPIQTVVRHGIAWIALNDEPTDLNAENVAGYISTIMLADLVGLDQLEIGAEVVKERRRKLRREKEKRKRAENFIKL